MAVYWALTIFYIITSVQSNSALTPCLQVTPIVNWNSNNDEMEYNDEGEREISSIVSSQQPPLVNVSNIKELVIDFRIQDGLHIPVCAEVYIVKDFELLRVTTINWSFQFDTIVKKAHQLLNFIRRLRKFSMTPMTLTKFYRCTIEGNLTGEL